MTMPFLRTKWVHFAFLAFLFLGGHDSVKAQSWTIESSNGYVAAGDTAVSSGTGWYVNQRGKCTNHIVEFNYSVWQSVHWNCWYTGAPALGWAQMGPSGDQVDGMSDLMRYSPSLGIHVTSQWFCDGGYGIGIFVLNEDGC
jgi:hypothetical protein